MTEVDRAKLKVALGRHYAAQREAARPEEIDALTRLMLEEDARTRGTRPRRMGPIAFVAAQVRFIPAWTWAAQLLVVMLMAAVAATSISADATKAAVGMLSAATVLVGAPIVHASKRHGVAELEYSCANDTASVMMARLIALGCSSSFAVALMVGATAASIDASAFSVALWTCPPFFCSCAGSLALLRKAPSSSAMTLCAAWALACAVALVAAGSMFPEMYAAGSLATWAAAAAAALVWLVREVVQTCRAVTAGLDAFSPYMARTRN